MRATLDTSSVVRAFLYPSGYPGRVLAAWRAGRFVLVTSAPCLAELDEVLYRPRLRLPSAAVRIVLEEMRLRGVLVAITEAPQGCIDPKDDMFIETAREGRADFLVSEDRHLLWMTTPALPVLGAAAFFLRLPTP